MLRNEKEKNICIVGAGPGGLATAISLLEKAKSNTEQHFNITIVEKRSADYTRRQKLVLVDHSIKGTTNILWDEFCKQVFYPNNKIEVNQEGVLCFDGQPCPLPLNARQKFLRKILRQELVRPRDRINFSVKSLEMALKEHIDDQRLNNVTVKFNYQSDVSSIVTNEKTSTIEMTHQHKDKSSFEFDVLVISEGERRETIQKINMLADNKSLAIKPFTYTELGKNDYFMTDRKKYNQPFFTARLICDKPSNEEYNEATHKDNLLFIEKIGARASTVYVEDNLYNKAQPGWKLRSFFTIDLPPQLLDLETQERQEIATEIAKTFLSITYKLPKECFSLDPKVSSALNPLCYTVNLKSVDNPVRKLTNGSHIVLLGDCATSAYQNTGFSSEIALNEGIMLAKCITKLSKDIVDEESDYSDKEIDDSFLPYVELFLKYQQYFESFIDNEYHLNVNTIPHSGKLLLFQQPKSPKSLEFLENHVKVNQASYNLSYEFPWNDNTLEKTIYSIRNLAQHAKAGNDFAAYALATQLENGIPYHKKQPSGEMTTATYTNLPQSAFYWTMLKECYPIDDKHINELKSKFTERQQQVYDILIQEWENIKSSSSIPSTPIPRP